jgi:hypothetical protein
MTVVQNRSTNKPVSGSLSLGTKKKQTIYISENDGRNNPAYLKSHPGQIVVLSEADFSKWLMQEYYLDSTSLDSSPTSISLNDSETSTSLGTIDPTISVPGQPVWNKSDIRYISTDTGILENITISFDPSSTDPGDGSYTYHVYYEQATNTTANTTSNTTTPTPAGPIPITGTGSTGSGSTPQAVSTNINTPVGTIITVNHTSSFFAISWNALSNAISYTVTVNGTNVPYSSPTSGSTSFVIPSSGGNSSAGSIATGSLSFGVFTFVLNQLSGAFSGTYVVSVQANYAKGSSAGVTYNVTI